MAMAGMGALAGENIRRRYGYQPDTAGYGTIMRAGNAPSTYDLGGRLMPGGDRIFVGYNKDHIPQYVPSIDFPQRPDPGISRDPVYGNTLGLPRGGVVIEGGGPGAPGRYPYPDMNVPPDENVSPDANPRLRWDYNIPSGDYVGIGDDWMTGGSGDSGGLLPTPRGGWPRAVAANPNAYPVPGGGFTPTRRSLFGLPLGSTSDPNVAGDWVDNADRPFLPRIGRTLRHLTGWLTGASNQDPTGGNFPASYGAGYDLVPGEIGMGGNFLRMDPNTGKPIYNPLGRIDRPGGAAGGRSGYGSGRFGGPTVSFGYGGSMIGSSSGSLFGGIGGNPSHGQVEFT